MSQNIFSLIVNCQNHSEGALIDIIDKFKPLLSKYSYKLHYDDAFYDLQLAFIEIVYGLPIDNFSDSPESEPFLVSYICKSLYTRYIQLSKKKQELERYSMCGEEDLVEYLGFTSSDGTDFDLSEDVRESMKHLSAIQKKIIYGIYFMDYSDAELARHLGITRQAVGKTKHKALNILKLYLGL